jgi:hypothetical protein
MLFAILSVMEPARQNPATPSTPTQTPDEASEHTSYREPVDVDLDAMMRGEEPTITSSGLRTSPSSFTPQDAANQEAAPSYREPIDIDLETLEHEEDPTLIKTLSAREEKTFSTPHQSQEEDIVPTSSSVATDLKKMEERSPVSRGAAPHSENIARDIQRERNLIDSDIVRPSTAVGDERFAAHVMKDAQEAADTTLQEAHVQREEAVARGQKKAEEVGSRHTLKSLRTFESDIAEALKKQKTSMVQIALAEHHAETAKNEVAKQEEKKSSAFLLGSIALIVLSLVMIGIGGWYIFTGKGITSILGPQVTPLVYTEKTYELKGDELTTATLRATLAQEITQVTLSPDTIEYLYVTELITPIDTNENPYRSIVSTERFFTLTDNSAPDWMIRSLGDEFMLGIHAWNGNQVFFLFTVPNFDIAFSNMLSWEKDIPDDILPLIGWAGDRTVYTRPWEDLLVRNQDIRVLRDSTGNIVLAYTFFGSETLILATSIDTIDEVITRIIQKRREQ